MEIWLDTANLEEIQMGLERGIVHGITTNPSILAKSGQVLEEFLEKALRLQKGPIAIQVTGARAEEMIHQGEALHTFSPRILVKVPVTSEGLKAMYALSQEKIATMATTVFEPSQLLLASRSGASYVAPYYSKICEDDPNGLEILKGMIGLIHRYQLPVKLLIASLHSKEQVKECMEIGAHGATMNEKVLQELLVDHPMTLECLDRFHKDWVQAKPRKSLPL